MSCMLKIFASILNDRLIKWSNVNSILTDAQFGFRTGLGTVDAIFALHGLIEKYISSGKKLYCCFIYSTPKETHHLYAFTVVKKFNWR